MGQFFVRFRKGSPVTPPKSRTELSPDQVGQMLELAEKIERVSAVIGRNRGGYLNYPRDEQEEGALIRLRR